MYEVIHDSELWKDAKEQFDSMSLKERIPLYSKVMYPHKRGPLTLEDKLDVLMKLPNTTEILDQFLTDRQREVINLLDTGITYDDICIELGYANKSSIVQVINSIKKKIESEI